MMLQNARHVGDVDAARNDLTAAGKVDRREPCIEGGSDGEGHNGVILVGPELLQVRF